MEGLPVDKTLISNRVPRMGILCKYFIDFEFKQASFLRNYSTLTNFFLIIDYFWGEKEDFPVRQLSLL